MGKIQELDDRFKKFGTVSFTSITKTNDFIDHLENGQVMGTRCLDCGLSFFPAKIGLLSVPIQQYGMV